MYSASDLFQKAYAYCIKKYDCVAILSAKYGLLLLDDIIEPYNLTLNHMSSDEIKRWSNSIFTQMNDRLELVSFNKVFFHAGKKYRHFLITKLEANGIKCEAPLKNLGIGQQKAWYIQREE